MDINRAALMLPERDPFSNKGSFGKITLICGSKNMGGCCYLATMGALRSGAGLVTLCFPECLYSSLTSRLTENLFFPLKCDGDGYLTYDNIDRLLEVVNKSDVTVIGCGIGVTEDTKKLVKDLVLKAEKPLIIDADGLNCISDSVEVLLNAKTEILLTPHPGEMSRLIKKSIIDIENDREGTVFDFCAKYKVNLLLKGHETLVCDKDCTNLYINTTGNTGLSKGGAGDLLAGIIAGLYPSMKNIMFSAAVLGAFVHGLSADILKEKFTEFSMLPTDCANTLPQVFSLLVDALELE